MHTQAYAEAPYHSCTSPCPLGWTLLMDAGHTIGTDCEDCKQVTETTADGEEVGRVHPGCTGPPASLLKLRSGAGA